MKRICTLIALLLLLVSIAHAQHRYADLNVTMATPLTGDTAYVDEDFDIYARVINDGADTIKAEDTLAFAIFFDGSPIIFGSGSTGTPYIPFDGISISPGDTMYLGFSFTLFSGWATGPAEICVEVIPMNAADSISDTALVNNKSCSDITIWEFDPTAVANVSGNNRANKLNSIFPNPATSQVNFDLDVNSGGSTAIYVMDMMGKVMLQENKGVITNGHHTLSLQTTKLSAGIYMYKVVVGSESFTGKLQIE